MSAPAPLKLLIVGNRGGTNVGECFERAASSLGHEVRLIDARRAMEAPTWLRRFNWHFRGRRPTRLNQFSAEVLKLCRDWTPDLLLATGTAPVNQATMESISRLGITTLNYSTDDPWNPCARASWFLNSLPCYTHVFSTRRSNLNDFALAGCQSAHHLPFAYDPELHFVERPSGVDGDFDCDVLFVGGADLDRVPYCEAIARSGMKLALYGNYWNRHVATRAYSCGYADPRKMRLATGAARVCLCLVRRANRDGHTMRTFEAGAMGGCMLVEDTSEHREIFGEDGKVVVYFRDIPEMIDRAKWLLTLEQERRRLALAVRRLIVEGKNTYSDRLQSILEATRSSA